LLGWRILLEPERPLSGFKKTHMRVLNKKLFYCKVCHAKPWPGSGSGFSKSGSETPTTKPASFQFMSNVHRSGNYRNSVNI
jgi:hypothetical protein